MLKTSPRRASITGTPPTNASSVDAPDTGTPSVNASDRATARPIRMLVKLPGPRPTTIASIAAGSSTSSSTAARRSPARGRCEAPPVDRAQTAPNDVAVSKAKVVLTFDRHLPVELVDVLQGHARAHRRQPVPRVLRPLDERDCPIEVRLEVGPLLGIDVRDAIQVEVRDRHTAVVAVADRERRAVHRLRDAQRTGGPADERRLPGAEVSGHGDDVASSQHGRHARRERLRLLRGPRL